MIDTKALVPQLQKQVQLLTEDLIARSRSVDSIGSFLREEYDTSFDAGLFSQSFEEWSEDYLEQVAVSWVLACVFVRFLEDNALLDEGWIAGEGDRGKLADGHYEVYFRNNPHDTDREYLKYVFKEIGKIPAAKELFDDQKTPLWAVDPSGDAARKLLQFFKEIDAERGGLKRQFDTREVHTQPLVAVYEELAPQAQFLGDLYQDLSEHARKKYALLQTPEFIQQFILDRTLTPAIAEFGLKGLRLIDPACGSGHFLLGAFDRLFALWMQAEETKGNPVVAAQNAFDSIYGTDINPFAIAITRFRMLVAAVRACGIHRLHQQSYSWKLNLAVGDSLLRGKRPTFGEGRESILLQQEFEFEPTNRLRTEDPAAAHEILGQGYHVVVGNPPYITVKDRAQNENYRRLYSTCHRKYSLGVPFTQRFWDLAIREGEPDNGKGSDLSDAAGYIGLITANSFMKREFGKKLIEDFFPKSDLTHVLDTSGAYIPGHGTPTVILFGRSQKPVESTVRAVLGIKGEPSTPDDPSLGSVWQSIKSNIDVSDAHDEYTSTADVPRETFASHPWSIGGGGAAELLEVIVGNSSTTLSQTADVVGILGMTNADDIYLADKQSFSRQQVEPSLVRQLQLGDEIRDWETVESNYSIFPYDANESLVDISDSPGIFRWLWPVRTVLGNRATFGKGTYFSEGLPWWKWHQITLERLRTPLSIVFAEVATHNHFVLDRGGKVFKQTAPIVKLPAGVTEEDHLSLLGLLNSSTACFFLRQVCHNKGLLGQQSGITSEKWEQFIQQSGTAVGRLPLPSRTPLEYSIRIDTLVHRRTRITPNAVLARWKAEELSTLLAIACAEEFSLRGQLIALQEELDWQCYELYGLLREDLRYSGDDLPELALGERAFEIVMARQLAAGELETSWFARHGSTPITDLPAHWPAAYRQLVERRIKLIETNKEIALIERPEYKRRWNAEPWEERQQRALQSWLLDRLESPRYRQGTPDHPELTTTAQMADTASADREFLEVAALYRGRPDFDVSLLVAELVEAESVPILPILRYKPPGLRKREVWERTWNLQRQEDAGQEVGAIPVPPKYASSDFTKSDYWRLRGKLDVPKERWISFPHCATESDASLVVGWAGWNHLQQATAIVSFYDARKREGWEAARLAPLLAAIDELLPWIHQWHTEIDPEFGETAGQSLQTMLEQDAHELGLTVNDLRQWTPPATPRRSRATARSNPATS